MTRFEEIDLRRLQQLAAASNWFRLGPVFGRGLERTITGTLKVRAYAWRIDQDEPVLRPAVWNVSFVLARGMAVQPLALIRPDDDGFLPAGGNISDWTPHRGPHGDAHVLPGMVCYADRWHPNFTLAWVAHQVARILVGEVLNLEAEPLSRRGRDFQAAALAQAKLPTQILSAPRQELLYLDMPSADVNSDPGEIEFHDVSK